MKRFVLSIFLCLLLSAEGYATEPFRSEEYISETKRYRIILNPVLRGEYPNSSSLQLIDKEENKEFSFSTDQLGLDYIHQNMVMSTAGLGWYRNSIAAFDREEKFFAIKLPWPQFVVVDLRERVIVENPSDEVLKETTENIKKLALQWLDSKEPYQRQTAAMACKDLKISESIPKLRELLKDKDFYTMYSGNNSEGTIVLYVRKAAKEALMSFGEDADNVRTELSEKECLRLKGYQYVINWEDEKCR